VVVPGPYPGAGWHGRGATVVVGAAVAAARVLVIVVIAGEAAEPALEPHAANVLAAATVASAVRSVRLRLMGEERTA